MLHLRMDRFNWKATQPMPFIKDRAGFKQEWELCEADPKRKTDLLYKHLEQNISNWITMLTNVESFRNIEYMTLLTYLGVEEPTDLLNEWVTNNREELPAIIFESYLRVLQNPPITKWTVSTRQWFFLTSKFMRYTLALLIRRWKHFNTKHSKIELRHMDSLPEPVCDNHEDLTNLRYEINNLPDYEYYLITLYLNDMSRTDYESVTYTTSSFVYLWRTINDYLKETDS